MKNIHIGIIREGKVPADTRVPLTPEQCREIILKNPQLNISVQPSEHRCFSDAAYIDQGIRLSEDLSSCDVLLGVKEVPIDQLLADKTYFFFSHTIKEQAYNRKLLKVILEKNIELIDWECLEENGKRVIGFGRYAGIVGAHNGLRAFGKRSGKYDLKAAHKATDLEELVNKYQHLDWPPFKIVLTGEGRVAKGARELLLAYNIEEIDPSEFGIRRPLKAIFCHLKYQDFYRHKSDGHYNRQEFFDHPQDYECLFEPYFTTADLFINGIFWDPDGPVFFTPQDTLRDHFSIKTIADITCDIAPLSSVPTTLRPSVIGNDVYGYDPQTGKETHPYQPNSIDVMAVDNLPNELPRDASTDFGEVVSSLIVPELLKDHSEILQGGTICCEGVLTEKFDYLNDFVNAEKPLT